jgi:hypothetical protein
MFKSNELLDWIFFDNIYKSFYYYYLGSDFQIKEKWF